MPVVVESVAGVAPLCTAAPAHGSTAEFGRISQGGDGLAMERSPASAGCRGGGCRTPRPPNRPTGPRAAVEGEQLVQRAQVQHLSFSIGRVLRMEIRLRPGAILDQAVTTLREQLGALQNVYTSTPVDSYVNWTDEAYRQLSNYVLPSQVESLIETKRYWALRPDASNSGWIAATRGA